MIRTELSSLERKILFSEHQLSSLFDISLLSLSVSPFCIYKILFKHFIRGGKAQPELVLTSLDYSSDLCEQDGTNARCEEVGRTCCDNDHSHHSNTSFVDSAAPPVNVRSSVQDIDPVCSGVLNAFRMSE